MNSQILIVDDEPLQRQMLSTLIKRRLYSDVEIAGNGLECLNMLETTAGKSIKLIILDLEMPVMNGMETLQTLRQKYPHIAVIMLTGSQYLDTAVTAMKLGATDFITKPYEGERIIVTVQNTLKLTVLAKEVQRLRSEKDRTSALQNLIGADGGLERVITIGRKAAASDIPVLLTGETGVGKEVFAFKKILPRRRGKFERDKGIEDRVSSKI
jgi:DNA-binding NtrC family response regulator